VSVNADLTEGFADGFLRYVASCRASIERTFRAHLPLYAAAVLFCGATLIIASVYDIPITLGPSRVFLNTIPLFLLIAVSLAALRRLIVMIRVEKPEKPLAAMGAWMAAGFLEHDRPGKIFHAIVTFTPLMVTFAALKEAIPQINPFSWDATFTAWDRLLHLGTLPWEILQPILGHPPVTAAIAFIYNFWLIVMFFCLFWQVFTNRNSELRLQFLLAFAFTWFLGGNVLAVLFSSAGPCFYGGLGITPDVYAAQMAYLRETAAIWPVWSVNVQDLLWQSHVAGDGEITGISAMPSIHVTSSVIMAFLGWRTSRWAGIALTTFALAILIGSVHLAWHYAVDGYAGILLATIFWLMAGAISRAVTRQESRETAAI
jgi:hypothetical protein